MSYRLFLTSLAVILLTFAVNGDDKCMTPSKKLGACTPINNCPIILNALSNKNGLDGVAKQFLRDSTCRRDKNNKPVVCCESDAGPCLTPDGRSGSCVQIQRCNYFMKMIDKKPLFGEAVVDLLKNSECQYGSQNVARVCCPMYLEL